MMGEAFSEDSIFQFNDKWGDVIYLNLIHDDYSRQRILVIEKSSPESGGGFELNKPLARKLVKELIEEFKLNFEEIKK